MIAIAIAPPAAPAKMASNWVRSIILGPTMQQPGRIGEGASRQVSRSKQKGGSREAAARKERG